MNGISSCFHWCELVGPSIALVNKRDPSVYQSFCRTSNFRKLRRMFCFFPGKRLPRFQNWICVLYAHCGQKYGVVGHVFLPPISAYESVSGFRFARSSAFHSYFSQFDSQYWLIFCLQFMLYSPIKSCMRLLSARHPLRFHLTWSVSLPFPRYSWYTAEQFVFWFVW